MLLKIRARVWNPNGGKRPSAVQLTRAEDVTHGEVGNPGALVQADNKVLAYQPWEYIVVEQVGIRLPRHPLAL
jgi:hypothetical protein